MPNPVLLPSWFRMPFWNIDSQKMRLASLDEYLEELTLK
jgi:hypothetical protein